MDVVSHSATLDEAFLARIRKSVDIGDVIPSLKQGQPNRIASIGPEGVYVETRDSDRKASGPQLVPAWMILTAWNHLATHGSLSYVELVKHAKRSTFVCALLSRFPDVDVESTNPIVLRLDSQHVEATDVAAGVDAVEVEEVPLAGLESEWASYERVGDVSVLQMEAQLVARFEQYLKSHGRTVRRFRIKRPGAAPFFSDLADVDAGVLYEAKGSPERMNVRLALGQVLDYGRYVENLSLAILLPVNPEDDLIELLESYDVACVVEVSMNKFVDLTSLQRCP